MLVIVVVFPKKKKNLALAIVEGILNFAPKQTLPSPPPPKPSPRERKSNYFLHFFISQFRV